MKAVNSAGARNAHRANVLRLTKQDFLRILYHETKMLACKGIFAKPSIAQAHEMRTGRMP